MTDHTAACWRPDGRSVSTESTVSVQQRKVDEKERAYDSRFKMFLSEDRLPRPAQPKKMSRHDALMAMNIGPQNDVC